MIREAIQTLLADAEIKKAILDYLKSITPEPKEEWREIYRCQSDARRRFSEQASRAVGIPQNSDFRLYMRVYHNESGGVGRIVFFEYDARLFDVHRNRDLEYWLFTMPIDDTVLISESDPFKVIDRALELWPARKSAFEHKVEETSL